MGSFNRGYPADASFERSRSAQASGDAEYSGLDVAAGVALSFVASGVFLAKVGAEHAGTVARRMGRDAKATVAALKDSFSAGFLDTTAKRAKPEASLLPQTPSEVLSETPHSSVLSVLGAEAWVGFAVETTPTAISQQALGPRSSRTPTEDFVL